MLCNSKNLSMFFVFFFAGSEKVPTQVKDELQIIHPTFPGILMKNAQGLVWGGHTTGSTNKGQKWKVKLF